MSISGSLAVHAYADRAFGLGADRNGGKTTFLAKNTPIFLHGVVMPEAFELSQGGGTAFSCEAGTHNAVGGVFKVGYDVSLVIPSDSELLFSGGVRQTTGNLSVSGAGTLLVSGAPYLATGGARLNGLQQNSQVVLNVASNVLGAGNYLSVEGKNVRFRTMVLNAMVRGTLGDYSSNHLAVDTSATGFVWDLCGCDQEISGFSASPAKPEVTSESPALLHYFAHLNSNNFPLARPHWANTNNWLVFSGKAGLAYEGADGVRNLKLVTTSPTKGTLAVKSGCLTLAKAGLDRAPMMKNEGGKWVFDKYVETSYEGGNWPNAESVSVTGGRLVIEHNRALGRQVRIDLGGDGKLEIMGGVVLKCKAMTRNGATLPPGTYGSSDSSAMNKDDAFFAGSGVVRVGKSGLIAVVK